VTPKELGNHYKLADAGEDIAVGSMLARVPVAVSRRRRSLVAASPGSAPRTSSAISRSGIGRSSC
jgi:hypothetical protein